MKRLILFTCLLGLTLGLAAQSVGINPTGATPDASAILDVQDTNKGMLLPRMTTAQRDAIPSPATGLYIYNVDDSCFNYYTGAQWILDCGLTRETKMPGPTSFASLNPAGESSISDLVSDANGNLYMVGYFSVVASFGDITLTSDGDDDVFVLKMNPVGKVIWAQRGGGTSEDQGVGITLDAAGNVYVTGSFEGTASFGTLPPLSSDGNRDIFIAKYNASGQVQWVNKAGGTGDNIGVGLSTDGSGNILLTGVFAGAATFGTLTALTSSGLSDIFVAKYNASGQALWATKAGGTGNDGGIRIATDATGNSYVAGFFSGTAIFGTLPSVNSAGGFDAFLMRVTSAGQVQWARRMGGASNDYGNDVAIDAAGNLYLTGSFQGSASFETLPSLTSGGSDDMFVAKYNAAGQGQWVQKYGGTGSEGGQSIVLDAGGNLYVTGYYNGASSFGTITLPSSASGADDIFVTRLDPTGQTTWVQTAGGTGPDLGYAIAADPLGNVHSGGVYNAPATFGSFLLNEGSSSGNGYVWSLQATSGQDVVIDRTLSDIQSGVESQTLSFTSPNLIISSGNSVNLSAIQDNLGNHNATTRLRLNNQPMYLRSGTDLNHGLRYAGSSSQFANFSPDGPVLFGFAGGILGTTTGIETGVLYWNRNGRVGIGTNSPQSRLDVEGGLAVGSTYAGTNAAPTNGAIIEGNVGIGLTNPTRGKLEISGGLSVDLGSIGYLPQSGTTGNSNPGSYLYSLYADQRIAALEVFAHSDRRIKDIAGISDGEKDLQTLLQIEVTDYQLRDSIQHGQRPIKKVIAQQVSEVYPQAVSTDLTEIVPDIYQRAEVQDSWIMLATDLKVGERVKLITAQSAEVHEVIAVEADRFQVATLQLSPFNSELPTTNSDPRTLFVYGREVDDFHTVDYEAISMLNVSATQAQQHIIEAQQAEISALKSQLQQTQQAQRAHQRIMDTLAARLQQLEDAQATPHSALVSPNQTLSHPLTPAQKQNPGNEITISKLQYPED